MNFIMNIQKLYGIELVRLTKTMELVEIILLSILLIIIPFLLGQPQILIGIIINFLLARNAITMKKWKNMPAIIFPSTGAFARGLVFGPYTVYLAYIIPAIWLGNFIFVCFVKLFASENTFKAIFVSSIAKSSVIFLYALALVRFSIIPDIFLSSMGILQLTTAIIGSSICLFLSRSEMNY